MNVHEWSEWGEFGFAAANVHFPRMSTFRMIHLLVGIILVQDIVGGEVIGEVVSKYSSLS